MLTPGVTQNGPQAADNEPFQKSSLAAPAKAQLWVKDLPAHQTPRAHRWHQHCPCRWEQAKHWMEALPEVVGTIPGFDPRKQVINTLGCALKARVCLSAVYFHTKCLLQQAAKEAGWCWALGSALPGKPQRCSSSSSPWAEAQPSSCNPPGREASQLSTNTRPLTRVSLGALLKTHLRQSRGLH